MSRGPGAVERGVLDALARYGPKNSTEHAQDIFGLSERLDLEPTMAQLGSVRRAIRHLAARGMVVEYYSGSGRNYWQLQNPKSERGDGGAAATRKGSPRRTTLPLPTSS